jgi:hypothetical protein
MGKSLRTLFELFGLSFDGRFSNFCQQEELVKGFQENPAAQHEFIRQLEK